MKLARSVSAPLILAAMLAAAVAARAEVAGSSTPGPSDGQAAKPLTGDSTLAEWNAATPAERNAVAVALARNRLAPDAPKLDIAKMAMEITGCLSKTARDTRVSGWKVAPTATTCLTAPEHERK